MSEAQTMALKLTETDGTVSQAAPPDYVVATGRKPQLETAFVDSATAWLPIPLTIHNTRSARIEKPVVIPRIDISGRLSVPPPFMRAYSPELRPHDINERDFVAFIDNLAVVQAPPVPFQALDVAGHAVGFVPHHWAIFAGAGMNVAAGIGTAAVSYGRTCHFLEKVNREYFAPRNLQVSVCRYQRLVERLAVSPGAAVLADKDPQAGIESIRDRCMSALEPYVAKLSLDVPPPSGERNILDNIAAKGIERKRRKQDNNHRKESKDDGYSSDSSSSSSSDTSSDEDKARRKAARRVRKIDRKAKKVLRKHPERAAEIEEIRARKVQKFENKPVRNAEKGTVKMTRRMRKDLDKVKRLEFLVVEARTEQYPLT